MRIFACFLLYAFMFLNSVFLTESSPLPPKNEGPSQRTHYRRDSTGRLVKCDEDANDVANRPNEIIPPPNPLIPGEPRRPEILKQKIKFNHGEFVLRGDRRVGIVHNGLLVDYPIQDMRRATLLIPQPGDIYKSGNVKLIFENRQVGWQPFR